MRLDQELVQRKLCESRSEAQELITQGAVFVDGLLCLKQAKNISSASLVSITKRREFVSRGGEKLKGALSHIFGDDDGIRQFCSNKTALDIGSSTGGFSDCLLSYGVASVDAVDVGTSQLHYKLKSDKRVSSFENTDIRSFHSVNSYDIIVADLSFIPLTSVLDTIIALGSKRTQFFLLIKPQFEVGKGKTKKGIVKEDSLVKEILTKYAVLTKQKEMSSIEIFASEIQGGDGNQEYFLYAVL